MRALVTGHRGFVGRHIATALKQRGYDVTGVDIRDPHPYHGQDCREFFRKYTDHYDIVVHCAAVVGGRTMIDGEPLWLAAEDLSIDAELFRWVRRTRPGRVVLFSSSAAYPRARQTQLWAGAPGLMEHWLDFGEHEDFGQPDATYGWVKLTLERLAAEANAEGIRTHVFRPFSGYGADQDFDYPFPAIVRRALAHPNASTPFKVWGSPDSARDWVHIDDVVDCVLAHIDADVIGPVNICTGVATTFRELASTALAAVGFAGTEVVGDSTKPTGVFWRVGDPTEMQRVYTPRITIAEGIARAITAAR